MARFSIRDNESLNDLVKRLSSRPPKHPTYRLVLHRCQNHDTVYMVSVWKNQGTRDDPRCSEHRIAGPKCCNAWSTLGYLALTPTLGFIIFRTIGAP